MFGKDWQLKTPVAFLIFNRPDTTKKAFAQIAKVKPPKLLVVADGPRSDYPNDVEKCAAARAVIEDVNWPCEVLVNYADVNLGCQQRVSSGLDWVFTNVEEAIILEDDCLPHHTFFRFCENLLEEYRDDKRVMHISGDNFQFGRRRTEYSYYFSYYTHCWGWASWKRAWQHYDYHMTLWPTVKKGEWLRDILKNERAFRYWENIFQKVHDGLVNSWAYRWQFTCWTLSGLTVLPGVNLVSNIGYREDATHTKFSDTKFANMTTGFMSFPLCRPTFIVRDVQADDFTQHTLFGSGSLLMRIKRKIGKVLR